ncbi:MAG: hypothetical protein D6730_12975 [Bacteroidetes bacterium]|nr:MAG: hypothetical protein D6730_12975 [Bacteroidota bacterium]
MLAFGLASCAVAQKKFTKGERGALKELKAKTIKDARKEARKMKKQGFKPFPGGLPLEMQLQDSWIKQLEVNEEGHEKYLYADGNGVGKTQTAAEFQAMEVAKLQLAGQISNEVIQIIEGKIANEQIDRETGNSLTKIVSGSKNYVVESLPYVKPRLKVIREVGKRDVEVQVKLFYSYEESLAAAEASMERRAREELESEADELIEEIDNIFDNVFQRRGERRGRNR